jgi:D-serine deaminase-like pyridoxal phosphate-dependent protein
MKMTFDLPAIAGTYRISRPDEIETPRLLVFHDRVEENIARMRRAVAQITGSDRLDLLCPHVKTHKSPWVTHKLMQNGVSFFKATPNEIEMLARVGAPRVLVAYPPLPHLVKKLSKLAESHPHTAWVVQISQPEHVAWILENSALCWDYMIDLDIGMHRTGIAPHRALEIWQQCQRSNRLRFAGLHAYDGHIHHPIRRPARPNRLVVCKTCCRRQNNSAAPALMAELVVGGTPSALLDLQNLVDLRPQARIAISPGTWIYHDTTYDALMPGAFVPLP